MALPAISISAPIVPIVQMTARPKMRRMGIAALGPKPRTTKPAPGHKIFPYLLRNLVIERPNHVWAADITYVPVGRGFLYLVAIIDWAGRAVLDGGYRTRWMSPSALRRWRRRSVSSPKGDRGFESLSLHHRVCPDENCQAE